MAQPAPTQPIYQGPSTLQLIAVQMAPYVLGGAVVLGGAYYLYWRVGGFSGVWKSFSHGFELVIEKPTKEFFDSVGAASYTRGSGTIPPLNQCPPGWRTDALTCFRESDWKTMGRLSGDVKCNEGEELSGGLCYKKCKKGYHGVGPVCWIDAFGTQEIIKVYETQDYKNVAGAAETARTNIMEGIGNAIFKKKIMETGDYQNVSNSYETGTNKFTAAIDAVYQQQKNKM
jgi:hypothetical protein